MQYLAAAGLAALAALVILLKTGKKVPSRVVLNSPTSVWPIGVVVFATLAALTVAAIAASLDADPGVVIVLTVGAWFFAGLIGRTKTGTRLVYDRGGRQFEPGSVMAAIGIFFAIFFWLLLRAGI